MGRHQGKLEVRAKSQTYYTAFGLTMAGISSRALAFGSPENKKKYQQYEFNSDFDINLYESFYRTHDPQIGRFLQIDPKPTHFESPYAAMGNNPIRNTDFLGDELSGTDRKSAQRELEIIRNSFQGENAAGLKSLFKLKGNGLTFKKISEKKLQKALSKIDNADTKKLAEGYAKAVNSSDKMFVSVVTKDENVQLSNKQISSDFKGVMSDSKNGMFAIDGVIGRKFEDYGGGLTVVSGNQSVSVLVMDSKAPTQYVDGSGNSVTGTASVGETSSHEVLGHALGVLSGTAQKSSQDNINAIRMSNLFLRATGNSQYRNGSDHGGVLTKEVATGMPDFY